MRENGLVTGVGECEREQRRGASFRLIETETIMETMINVHCRLDILCDDRVLRGVFCLSMCCSWIYKMCAGDMCVVP